MMYPEFKLRYNILAAKAVAKAKNDKAAAGAVMEEFREDRIGEVLAWLRSGARGKASRMQFKKLQDQKLALYCCQRTIRNYYIGKSWLWWHIWTAIKPNLKCTQFGKYKQEYEEKIAKAIADREKVQAVYDGLAGQKNELELALKSGGS